MEIAPEIMPGMCEDTRGPLVEIKSGIIVPGKIPGFISGNDAGLVL